MKEIVEKAKAIVFNRQKAYQTVFNDGEMAKHILEDLAKFCRANESTFHEDPRVHAVLEGRREVWLRIRQHLDMGSEDLWNRYSKKE